MDVKPCKSSWYVGASSLALLTFAAYFSTFQNLYIWDDDLYLTQNPYLNDFDGLKRLWFDVEAMLQYYPMVFSSFWIENKIWGLDPAGYHVTNVLIHCMNVVLLWRILVFLEIKGSWLAAAIFAIHPVQVESVAWITERKNLLSGFFLFLSLYSFLRFYKPVQPSESNIRKTKIWSIYGLSILLFLCALLSKTVTCTLPAIILLIFWWKENRICKEVVFLTIPFFVVGLCFAFLTAWLEKYHAGALGPDWDFSVLDRFLIAGRALWFYIGKLIFPSPLIFIYPRWIIDDSIWWQYVYPLAFLALICLFWLLRNRIGRGPLAGILFFSGTLFPALGFFNVYPMLFSFVADHFQYIACIGVIVIFSSGLVRVMDRLQPFLHWGVVISLLMLLGSLTWFQSHIYKNVFSLWTDTIKKNPGAWLAHNNLGVEYESLGKMSLAISSFETSLQYKPDFHMAHYNLGNIYKKLGKFKDSVSPYRKALEINPNYYQAHFNLGYAYQSLGQLGDSIESYEKALAINPGYFKAQFNLGNAYRDLGRLEEAMEIYEEARAVNSVFYVTHFNLGNTYRDLGRLEEAVESYKIALVSKPDHLLSLINMGNVLNQLNKNQLAVNALSRAIELSPDDTNARYSLGVVYAKTGQLEKARKAFEAILRLEPNDLKAKNELNKMR